MPLRIRIRSATPKGSLTTSSPPCARPAPARGLRLDSVARQRFTTSPARVQPGTRFAGAPQHDDRAHGEGHRAPDRAGDRPLHDPEARPGPVRHLRLARQPDRNHQRRARPGFNVLFVREGAREHSQIQRYLRNVMSVRLFMSVISLLLLAALVVPFGLSALLVPGFVLMVLTSYSTLLRNGLYAVQQLGYEAVAVV